MKIEFKNRVILKEMKAVPASVVSVPFLEIIKIEDLPNEKKVIAYTDNQYAKSLVLWEGEAYDKAGQWTDNDVINRIKEIYETTNITPR